MEKNISYKKIWQVSYPIILGSIAQNLINFTDTAFLGRVGEVALGGGALGGIFYLAVFMLGLGFGMGEQILVARRLGENHFKEIGKIVNQSLIFLLMLALVAFIILRFGSEWILGNYVQSQEVKLSTAAFLDFRAYGIFFAFINVLYRSLYVGLANTKIITYTTFLLAGVNIILDYLLIFGHFGFPKMGISGAALASVIAEISAMIYFIIYTHIKLDRKKYELFRKIKFEKQRMMRLLKVATPTMIQQFVSLSVWFVFFLFVEKLGEASLAVSNIIRSIYVLLMVPIWGFATASNTLVSFLMGKGRSNDVMKLIYKILILSFGSVLLIVIGGFIFPKAFLSVYTNNTVLISMGIPVLKVVSIGALFLSIGFIFFSGVAGTGRTNISMLIEFLVLTIYLFYTHAVIFSWHGDVSMAWTAEWVYGFLMSFISWIYLKSGKWKTYKI